MIQLQGGKTYNKWVAYGQAKTANMLMALSLSLKLANRGLQAFSLHPGVIFTNLGGHLDWNTDVGLRRSFLAFLLTLMNKVVYLAHTCKHDHVNADKRSTRIPRQTARKS